jgi:hypothetical protein
MYNDNIRVNFSLEQIGNKWFSKLNTLNPSGYFT